MSEERDTKAAEGCTSAIIGLIGIIITASWWVGKLLGLFHKRLSMLLRHKYEEGKGWNPIYGIPIMLIWFLYAAFVIFYLLPYIWQLLIEYAKTPIIVRVLPGYSKLIIHIADEIKKFYYSITMQSKEYFQGQNYIVIFYALIFNPIGLISFLYYRFFYSHPISEELKSYDISISLPRKFSMDKEYKKVEKIAKKNKQPVTFLGYDWINKKPVFISDESRFYHVQLIGTTGSGKTHFVILPMMWQDIKKGRGVIFVDAKGDIETIKEVKQMCKLLGREKDFLLFSMRDDEISNTYNPLSLGNPTQLKDKIISGMSFTEPFYKLECESGLQILFNELRKKNKQASLPLLNDLLSSPSSEYPEFANFFDTHKERILNIRSHISLLMSAPFSYLFYGDEINLYDVYMNNKIVYFALDTLGYKDTAERLGKMITGDINALCSKVQALNFDDRKEFAVYIDEYAKFGTKNFETTLAQARSAKFMVLVSHQTYSDLNEISPNHLQIVLGNTNTRILLKTNDPDTLEHFAREIGTQKTITTTHQVDTNISSPTGVGSLRVVDEYIIHPQILRQLQTGIGAIKTLDGTTLLLLDKLFLDTGNVVLQKIERKKEEQKPLQNQDMTKEKDLL